MTDNQTENLVPKLRFTEFNNKEEWERKTIEEILTVNSGRDYKHLQPGNIPVYGTGGYMLSVNDKLSDVDAIGIGRKGTIDKPQYLKAPFWTVDTLFYLTKKYDYNLKFLFYLLQTIEWKKYSEQTGVPSLTRASIEGIEVKVPRSLEEQQKIASCLSSIDSYISSIYEKIEQLKAHKKSLMQKLFPQNGKTVPEYRFPEFRQDGEWKRKNLKEIITVNSGRDYKHLDAGEIPVYGTGGYMLSVNDKLSDIDAVGIGRKGTIDKPQYLKAPFWTVDTLFFLTNKEGYDIEFIYYLAQIIPWKKYGEQTGVPSLSKISIDNLEVSVPESNTEQTKIAQCLSFLDKELSLLEEKILILDSQKKGLSQQLFPQN